MKFLTGLFVVAAVLFASGNQAIAATSHRHVHVAVCDYRPAGVLRAGHTVFLSDIQKSCRKVEATTATDDNFFDADSTYLLGKKDCCYKWSYYAGRWYAQWECTTVGTVVAAGITFVGWPAAPWALGGILAGGLFTGGCEMGYSDSHPAVDYLYGLPHSSYCWEVYPGGSFSRKFGECVA